MTIAVLGTGMIGRVIAKDLSQQYDVTAFDLNSESLAELNKTHPEIKTAAADFTLYSEYANWLETFDIVVIAVPGYMGYKTLEAVINAGKNVVDISFFPENGLDLDKLSKQKEVTAIIDCGIAPGINNMILGRENEEMNVSSFSCYVGGLPIERKKPFEYKAPFSPIDVIQEYIRPVRLMESGVVVTKQPLTDREIITIERIGELEAFNTDGLRSLLYTMKHIPDMKEKTLRYPAHVNLIVAMQQAGFFDTTPLRIDEVDISPLEFVSKLLINQWKLEPGEEEFTVMKVIIKGIAGKNEKTVEYNLLDYYDRITGTSSMARTTGYTCAAAVNLLAHNLYTEKGIVPPELIGKNKSCFDFIETYLRQRKVAWKRTEQ